MDLSQLLSLIDQIAIVPASESHISLHVKAISVYNKNNIGSNTASYNICDGCCCHRSYLRYIYREEKDMMMA
jgi:hypothetical protein